MQKKVGIIGAGPAGLTAAYILVKEKIDVTVFEKDKQYVGGISRTEKYKGYHFDIGGHRFFSKSKEVEDFWSEILGDEMINRPRKSRIFYKNKFYSYPLKAFEALNNLGIITSIQCILSFFKSKAFPIKNPKSFQDWVTNQFGEKLFSIFFKTYTEKVWGMNCDEISSDWAAQRIKGLSLWTAAKDAIFPKKHTKSGEIIKTLIDTFRYPRKGPGMMWEKCTELIQKNNGRVLMNENISAITNKNDKWQIVSNGIQHEFDYLISSMPLREFVTILKDKLPANSILAASKLRYRDFLTVILITQDRNVFDDNWIYIHSPEVKVGRIQNFKSWSPDMIPDPNMACYGLEYFCFEGDGLWNSSDDILINLAKKEMIQLGLLSNSQTTEGYVVRQPKAYPVYDEEYKNNISEIKNGLSQLSNVYVIGRNGMHKYNNQDHSMMTAMLAAKNILAGKDYFDLWNVNEDAEYHEEGNLSEDQFQAGRQVPKKV